MAIRFIMSRYLFVHVLILGGGLFGSLFCSPFCWGGVRAIMIISVIIVITIKYICVFIHACTLGNGLFREFAKTVADCHFSVEVHKRDTLQKCLRYVSLQRWNKHPQACLQTLLSFSGGLREEIRATSFN